MIKKSRKSKNFKLWIVIVSLNLIAFSCSLAILLYSFYAYANYQTHLSNPKTNNGVNALWLRHSWVGDKKEEKEYKDLANKLKRYHITDGFFHVGPLDGDGNIPKERYLYASRLVEMMGKYYPELNTQAYIGQLIIESGGPLDIYKEDVRYKIAKTADEFLKLGFDGIHYDIESIPSGNKEFIDILDRTKALGSMDGKILSAATKKIEPSVIFELVRAIPGTDPYWEPGYFKEVMRHVDQIAVMSYDTIMPTDWAYGTFMDKLTRRMITVMQEVDSSKTVFMGIPTYEEESFYFNAEAENEISGLKGIQIGLSKSDTKDINFGVGIFAEWTTEEHEWEHYEKVWLGKV